MSKRFVKLLSDHVHVRLDPKRSTTQGGVIIPDTSAQSLRTGVVLDTGPGRYVKVRKKGDYKSAFRTMVAKKGERVAFHIGSTDTKSGQSVSHHLADDERLIREDDILFVIDEGDVEIT